MGIIIVPTLGRLRKNAKVLGYLYINGLDILRASVVLYVFSPLLPYIPRYVFSDMKPQM